MKTCIISGQVLPEAQTMPASALRPTLLEFIQKSHPELTHDDYVSVDELNDFRAKYVEASLEEEVGELSQLEREVIDSLREHEILSESPDEEEALLNRTFGERVADLIASFGGSWKFILTFCGFLVLWIIINSVWAKGNGPDPYPFILLNLILSCIAALQAPVIMMSQKRQETRDRHHAEADYQINLKAELEIRHLHEKLDHLLRQHSERFLEIQQIQVELLRQIVRNQPLAGAGSPASVQQANEP